jgi:hypothetical protein
MTGMNKKKAIDMLGGSVTKAAKAIGILPQAVSMWPDILTPRISDRVHAAHARQVAARKRKPMQVEAA